MDTLQRLYTSWLSHPPIVLIIAGLLLVGSIALSALPSEVTVAEDVQIFFLDRDLLFGFFISTLLIIAYVGWQFDNQPGRTIVIAVAAALVGSIIRMLFPLAASGGWLPAWAGLLFGVFLIALYSVWRVRARFAMVMVLMILYTIIITTGVVLGLTAAFSGAHLLGLLVIGVVTFGMGCFTCYRIHEKMRAAKRDAISQQISEGAHQAVRGLVFWGIGAIILALPFIIMGTAAIQSLGILFATGLCIGLFANLTFPVPLILVTGQMTVPQESGKGSRRDTKRRK